MKLEERTFGTPCTLPDIFYFFHSWKEGRRGRTLKGKEQYVKGKLQKDAGRMHFVTASKEHSQLMLQCPFFMLQMFKTSQYDFDV